MPKEWPEKPAPLDFPAILEATGKKLLDDVKPIEKEFVEDEQRFYDREQLEVFKNLQKHVAILEQIKDEAKQRKELAIKIFWLVVFWLLLILALISLDGLGLIKLSDTIVLALIGGTTVNVSSFFVIVAQYLFRHGDKRLEELL